MSDDIPGGEAQYADAARRYRLDGRIATGGMGVVWRATDTRLNRPVAVKILKHEYADDPQFQTRFETEARNAAALQHRGIAGVFDYASDPEGSAEPYLVMELVEGQPLSALLKQAKDSQRTLDAEVVRDLLAQTADALAVAHRAGIVHRDVKPANLLVTPDRTIKVTDFGIARAGDAAQITRTGAVMGTPQYLSPEQARGNPSTPASDVYSLGVVAFECLAGRRPFEAETAVATALAHLQQPVPELPSAVPADLAAVVRRALAKDPAQRYPDGAALAAALRGAETPPTGATAVLPAAPVAAGAAHIDRLDRPSAYAAPPADDDPTPTPTDDEATDGKKRSVLPVVLIVLLLVAAAIVVAFLLLGGDDEEEPAADDSPTRDRTSEPTSSATSETSEPEETTPETTPPETVDIDEADYLGRDRFEVEAELQRAGLSVRMFEDENPGGETPDTVSGLQPTGELTEDDTIDLHYWGPEPEPSSPETSETTPTESETTDTTEGEDG